MLWPMPSEENSVLLTPDVRSRISQLVRTCESIVRQQSGGETTLLLDDPFIGCHEDLIGIKFSMGKIKDPFEWADERDDSLDTDVVIKIFQNHPEDSTLSFFTPGAEEPFNVISFQMEGLGEDFAFVVPELFSKQPESSEIDKTNKNNKGALPS